jgi:hypothetical protein
MLLKKMGYAGTKRKMVLNSSTQRRTLSFFKLVAVAGFEPATFGL